MKYFLAITLVLATLKLAHVIDWSWYIIFLPVAGAAALGFLLIILAEALLRRAARNGDAYAALQLAFRDAGIR